MSRASAEKFRKVYPYVNPDTLVVLKGWGENDKKYMNDCYKVKLHNRPPLMFNVSREPAIRSIFLRNIQLKKP